MLTRGSVKYADDANADGDGANAENSGSNGTMTGSAAAAAAAVAVAVVANCGTCRFCLDKPKNGGENRLRRACERRQAQKRQIED